jgi:hypothetical protein
MSEEMPDFTSHRLLRRRNTRELDEAIERTLHEVPWPRAGHSLRGTRGRARMFGSMAFGGHNLRSSSACPDRDPSSGR